MKMSELIARYGDERVEFQNLDQCAINLDWGKKAGTKITFGTEQPINPNGTEKLGLVLWLDRKAVAEIVAANKACAEKAQAPDTRGEATPTPHGAP
jgi:hypothetical protein